MHVGGDPGGRRKFFSASRASLDIRGARAARKNGAPSASESTGVVGLFAHQRFKRVPLSPSQRGAIEASAAQADG
jgi:hypothetical protein